MEGTEVKTNQYLNQTNEKALQSLRSFLRCFVVTLASALIMIVCLIVGVAIGGMGGAMEIMASFFILMAILLVVMMVAATASLIFKIISIFRLGDLVKSVEIHVPEDQRTVGIRQLLLLAQQLKKLLILSVLITLASMLIPFVAEEEAMTTLSPLMFIVSVVILVMTVNKYKAMKKLSE